MKNLFLGILMVCGISSPALADYTALKETDLYNSYLVGHLATAAGPYYVMQLHINETGDRIVFRDGGLDYTRANNDCVASKFHIADSILNMDISCRSSCVKFNIQMDLTDVTKSDLKDDARIPVRVNGAAWELFEVEQHSESYFEE